MTDLAPFLETRPDVHSDIEVGSGHGSFTQMEHRVASLPFVVATLTKHGYSPRDFVVFQSAYFEAVFVELMLRQPGADRAKLMANTHINPLNIAFIEQHPADLQRLLDLYGPAKKTPEGSGGSANKH